MMVPLAVFLELAAGCGPAVHPATLAAVARTESRFDALAIGDNTTGRSHAPATAGEAVATAKALLERGHSLDLGLMQINSATLAGLGLTVADAFDPCASIAGGARVLVDGYRPAPGEDEQRALVRALSRYNTGSPVRGVANGYVAKVQAAAGHIVPALRGNAPPGTERGLHGASSPATATPPAPPAWDVYGRARQAREHARTGGPWPSHGRPPEPHGPAPSGTAGLVRPTAPPSPADDGR
ncbi:lytic transglycosylase domain-containing protein [Azospirillum sp.]|uniref:lytic transglycosylase domain-containing protein n=1 Tax=Azospirillum sp. TaxID=34012 RepID=UPI002D744A15|nr:lytic transglycosylase domain-containing protein [Azospirillum sp.]HYD70752.1 lytic transglycosylase domain-containing protein [Azospirillum sp.]